jgi:hypothetical protein
MLCAKSACELVKTLRVEADAGSASEFWPYMQMLPTVDLPYGWPQTDLLPLVGITGGTKEHPLFPECKLAEEYRGLVNVVESRGVKNEQNEVCMVPVFDLMFHGRGSKENARVEVQTKGSVVSLSTRAVAKGSEVLRAFGGNTEFIFANHGFVEANPTLWEKQVDDISKLLVWELTETGAVSFRRKSNHGFTFQQFTEYMSAHLMGLKMSGEVTETSLAGKKVGERFAMAVKFRKAHADAAVAAVNEAQKLVSRNDL